MVERQAVTAVTLGNGNALGGVLVELTVVDARVEQGADEGGLLVDGFGRQSPANEFIPVADDIRSLHPVGRLLPDDRQKIIERPPHIIDGPLRSVRVESLPVLEQFIESDLPRLGRVQA